MKRKISAILLIGALFLPVLATFMWLQHHKQVIRKEVKHRIIAGIDKDELVLLKFTDEAIGTQLRWEHDYEFEYKGEMYDIVESYKTGDTTYYWCWWDHRETHLNKKLASVVRHLMGNDKENKKKQKQLTVFLKSLYFTDIATWDSTMVPGQQQRKFVFWQKPYISYAAPPPTPPPVT